MFAKITVSYAACLTVVLATGTPGLSQDTVFLNKPGGGTTRLTGPITAMTPEGLTIKGKQVSAATIRRISVGKEPAAVNRLRQRMNAGQYASCLAGLDELTGLSDQPLIQQEIDFMRAYSSARLALDQGAIGAKEANAVVSKFLTDYPDSFHRYPAIEQYGLLKYALGEPQLAAQGFAKLKSAGWDQYRWQGLLLHGKMMQLTQQWDQAKQDYQAILDDTAPSPLTPRFQSLAKCELARIQGIRGQGREAIEQLRGLIKQAPKDDTLVASSIYNAMGAVYKESGQLKAARTAYLHTPLLFSGEMESTAESLYHLTKLWPQLNKDERGNAAREELKSKFPNSYWSGIVDQN